MATWAEFEQAAPEQAALGRELLKKYELAYLATVRKNGAPRVHPVCPVIAGGRLFVATAPESPKRFDLLRDGRYAMHFLPGDNDTECYVTGQAQRIEDEETRAMVVAAGRETILPDGGSLQIRPEEWLFEYGIEYVMTAHWEQVGTPNIRVFRKEWRAG